MCIDKYWGEGEEEKIPDHTGMPFQNEMDEEEFNYVIFGGATDDTIIKKNPDMTILS